MSRTRTAWSLTRGSLAGRIATLIAVTRLFSIPTRAEAQESEIETITIEALEIYDPGEAGRAWPCALADASPL